MSVYVDTSAWYALVDYDDGNHKRAVALLRQFSGSLITSDHVLVETWLLVSGRHNSATAEQLIGRIRRGVARIEPAVLADLEVAAEIGRVFSDQDFSIVDRTSWAIMQRLGIREAVAFDVDFFIYRYGSRRRRAFTVHN